MAYKTGECPDQCDGKASNRQIDVGQDLLLKFPPTAQARIVTLGKPMRCSYCGCVYVGTEKIGVWNSGVLGQGWHSRHLPDAP